jgi:DNA-binding XRE family transcriptional regulator
MDATHGNRQNRMHHNDCRTRLVFSRFTRHSRTNLFRKDKSMAAPSPSTVRHRLLIQKLRQLREEAGYTQAEVAEAMDWSESKQIKIERGNIPVRVPDVRALLVHY